MPVIRLDGVVCLWLALGLLLLPFSWLMAAVIAAVCHEFFHFIVAKILKVRILSVSIGIGGMVMEMEPMSRGREFLVAATGPLGSLLLGLMLHIFPELAICGIVQGAFNLLPIFPLDGGRLLHCLLGRWAVWMEAMCIFVILIVGVALGVRYGFYPVLFAFLITVKAIQRKFPCKESNLAVQ